MTQAQGRIALGNAGWRPVAAIFISFFKGISVQRILLSFTGRQDPFNSAGKDGPVLSLLQACKEKGLFDRTVLFSTSETEHVARKLAEIVRDRFEIPADVYDTGVNDPTDYAEILRGLRVQWSRVCSNFLGAQLYVSISSGSPHMHACWLMLASSGEVMGRLIYKRDSSQMKLGQAEVVEIDPRFIEFPKVPQFTVPEALPEISSDEVTETIRESGIIGNHPVMFDILNKAARYAQYDIPVLITGPTGTGKELLARFIHNVSRRRKRPFVPVHSGAIPDSLIESELFGYEKGAFTGAESRRPGKFENADQGTVFLDEIGDMPPIVQLKLLRALDSGAITPVGAGDPRPVNVRVIAATHRNLKQMVASETLPFREDLYYRLAGVTIELPALSERRTDIPAIASYIIGRFNRQYGKKLKIADTAMGLLQQRSWPGNVRELQHVLIDAAIMCRGDMIEPDDLKSFSGTDDSWQALRLPDLHEGFSLKIFKEEIGGKIIEKALQMSYGNQTLAAKLLGMTPAGVSDFMRRKKHSSKPT